MTRVVLPFMSLFIDESSTFSGADENSAKIFSNIKIDKNFSSDDENYENEMTIENICRELRIGIEKIEEKIEYYKFENVHYGEDNLLSSYMWAKNEEIRNICNFTKYDEGTLIRDMKRFSYLLKEVDKVLDYMVLHFEEKVFLKAF